MAEAAAKASGGSSQKMVTLVLDAIREANNPKGVSVVAIKKYITTKNPTMTEARLKTGLKKAFDTALEEGKIVRVRGQTDSGASLSGSYLLASQKKAKPASSVSQPPNIQVNSKSQTTKSAAGPASKVVKEPKAKKTTASSLEKPASELQADQGKPKKPRVKKQTSAASMRSSSRSPVVPPRQRMSCSPSMSGGPPAASGANRKSLSPAVNGVAARRSPSPVTSPHRGSKENLSPAVKASKIARPKAIGKAVATQPGGSASKPGPSKTGSAKVVKKVTKKKQ